MSRQASNFRGFTLIELIMVMAILVLVASVIAPNLRGFGIGRKTNDAGRMILAMTKYARTQSESEGRIYRLNLDQSTGAAWLTADNGGGGFTAPTNDFGDRYSLPEGVRMSVTVNPQANAQLNVPANVQQQTVQGPAPLEGGGGAAQYADAESARSRHDVRAIPARRADRSGHHPSDRYPGPHA